MGKREANNNQLEAIKYDGNKPLLIEAGPGAGKTFVLIERVKFLLKEKHIKPESLLVITFTVKAANELKERLINDSLIGTNMVNKMQISTIHSFCNKILSEYGPSGLKLLVTNIDSSQDDVQELRNMFLRKHMHDLGFNYEYYVPNGEISSVINKFDEYSTFNVDTHGLVEYIEKNRPINQDYLDLINKIRDENEFFVFPYDTVKEDKELKKSWYNAKYLAIAKAYPKYKELLDKEGVLDYNFLQIKALNLLKDSNILRKIGYKNILIDEFQDTDPIQMQIFETLMSQADSFTVVGDDDQSIYRFRGAIPQFFFDFPKKYNAKVITLQTNYRSTSDIVDFNEHFIKKNRPENSNKKLLANREKHTTVYYLKSEDELSQASKIADIIQHLKDNGKIKQFNDVGVLFRSVSGKVDELINEFNIKNIPYNLRTNFGLMENDEVKSIITLLWYLNGAHKPTLCTSWEKDWLNFKAFTNENFNSSDMFGLSDKTMEIFSNLEDEYRQNVIDVENSVCKQFNSRFKGKESFDKVFDRNHDVLEEVFKHVNKPEISMMGVDALKDLGITDEHDLDFFNQLQKLKKEFWEPENIENRLTILDVFYKLLNINNYLVNKSENDNIADKQQLQNLALISNTIYNYENMIDKYDLNGLFWYLNSNLENYSTPLLKDDDLDAVEILTVHTAKGLEFPVVILGSMEQDKFPMKYDSSKEQADWFNRKPNYYTPAKYLKYKEDNPELEEKINIMEENRIVYVAMTRAEDLLLLSCIPHHSRKKSEKDIHVPEILNTMIDETEIKKLDYENLDELEFTDAEEKELKNELITLFYSSFGVYEDCPHKYSLGYNYNFKLSDTENITFGNVVHETLDNLHSKSRESKITKEELSKIIDNTFESYSNIESDDEETIKSKENIKKYWDNYGSKSEIIGSEIPFNIRKENYELTGKIDLLIKKEDGTIKVIDFKNTFSEKVRNNKDYYAKQINIYVLALREDPDYNKYDVTEGEIFAMKDVKPINIPLVEKDIKEISDKLDNVALNIINENFQKDTKNCQRCQYECVICKGRN